MMSASHNDNAPPAGRTPLPPHVLPPDDYTFELFESSYEPNARRTGFILRYQAQVVSGEQAGRSFVFAFTLVHDNPQAVEIGQRDFAALRRAVGVHHPKFCDDLLWRPFQAIIGVRPRADGALGNTVKHIHFTRAAP